LRSALGLVRKSAIAMTLVALVGCGGGGGGGNSSVPAGSGGGGSTATASATVTVTIPNPPATSSTKRRPAYLTSYTQGIDLQAVQGGKASGYVFYPLSALQSNCKAATSGFVCTLQLMAPLGSSQLVVNTYDNTTKATSNILSTSTTNILVAQGTPNAFSVSTNPIIANIQTFQNQQGFQCPIIGTPATVSSTYSTMDADGGVLSGTIGNPFTASVSDTTGSITFSPGPYTTATGTFTLTYNGGVPTNGVAIVSAIGLTAQGVPNGVIGSGTITPIRATPLGPHYVYIADGANNLIDTYDVCAQTSTSGAIMLPAGTNPAELVYDRYNWNQNNAVKHVIAEGTGNNTLVVVDVVANSVLQTVSLTGTPRRMQSTYAAGGGDDLYVTVSPSKLVRFNIQTVSPYQIITPAAASNTVGSALGGLNLEGFGNDGFVADSGDGTVRAFNTNTLAIDATLSLGGSPAGVSGPSSDNLCALVTNKGNNTVSALKINATGTSTITQIGSPIALPGQPQSVTFFPSSNTAIVTTASAGAILVTCSGGTSFTQTASWTPFALTPTANVPSSYVAPASGPGSPLPAANTTSVYIVGTANGQGVLTAYNIGQNTPLFGAQFGTLSNPTGVVSGP